MNQVKVMESYGLVVNDDSHMRMGTMTPDSNTIVQ